MLKNIVKILFILTIVCCDKEEVTTTSFTNLTDLKLQIKYFSKFSSNIDSFFVNAGSAHNIQVFNNNTGRIPPTIGGDSDSCVISFSNGKSLFYSISVSPTQENILSISSYEYSFESTRNTDFYNYNYFITQEHIEKAE